MQTLILKLGIVHVNGGNLEVWKFYYSILGRLFTNDVKNCFNEIDWFLAAMDKAKEQGHEVKHCIVVRHLQRLNAFFESKTQNHNGCNGDAKNHYDEVSFHQSFKIKYIIL